MASSFPKVYANMDETCAFYLYTLYSKLAIGRAHSHMYNGKSQHIHRKHNTVRQLLSNGFISIDFIKLKENIANLLTKGLSREHVNYSLRGMGLKPLT